MNTQCTCCGLAFYPEAGYFVGSIYINYGATVAVVIVSLLVVRDVPERFQLIFFSCLAALTSLAFFRHSRSLWITIDFWINPWKPPEDNRSVRSAGRDVSESECGLAGPMDEYGGSDDGVSLVWEVKDFAILQGRM
jgi:hypothetical protein